jgi:hypothetical protein
VFGTISEEERNKIRSDPTHYWVFDYSLEGDEISNKWYRFITDSAVRYDVPFDKIVVVTSNLLEHQAYAEWNANNNITKQFNILVLNFWESVFLEGFFNREFSIDQTVKYIRKNNKRYFLSLNRRCRQFRILTTFLMHQSKVYNQGLISADSPSDGSIYNTKLLWGGWNNHVGLDEMAFQQYLSSLPWILDRIDFETNWYNTSPDHLYKRTLFSAVSETHYDDFGGTSLFYSEKTFKPMLYNHPILVFGQPGLNAQLASLGYRTYDRYFDLSFDSIQNPIVRLQAEIAQLEKVCEDLDSSSTEGKIEWVLQDQETLLHNKKHVRAQTFNISQLDKFIQTLEK